MPANAARAIGARAVGVRTSRTRAAMTAAVAGTATGVVVYRWLRSGPSIEHD
ncbi:MAG TPA: hypothetical protein VFA05_10800 [Gaiellaceae bacterium]|nr:hypothetical protein [Gaiellaceae bacterium]